MFAVSKFRKFGLVTLKWNEFCALHAISLKLSFLIILRIKLCNVCYN